VEDQDNGHLAAVKLSTCSEVTDMTGNERYFFSHLTKSWILHFVCSHHLKEHVFQEPVMSTVVGAIDEPKKIM